eukprot:764147-Hanusia_phi.AAC.2
MAASSQGVPHSLRRCRCSGHIVNARFDITRVTQASFVRNELNYHEAEKIEQSSDDSWLFTRDFRTLEFRKMIRDFNHVSTDT